MSDYRPMLNPTVILWDGKSRFGHDPRDWCFARCKKRVDVVRIQERTNQASYLAVDTRNGEGSVPTTQIMAGPTAMFMFEDPEEAMMFKLTWCGQ